ncbi:unnamed protein product [Thelazia callipaeda]|uniref:DUF4446 family protein n=1 Tax=Thelazia callipaeda TaxID=103827 RepID=A0A0N5CS71_THECL|nr:unnamed protein product [Thelazia callipaeda]
MSFNDAAQFCVGIPNEFATKLVLLLMSFTISLILICLFLLLIIYVRNRDKHKDLLSKAKDDLKHVIIEKASPYIVTPEQKFTQQLLASQAITSIECSVYDIADTLCYVAIHAKIADEFFHTSRTFIRLVPRGRTKFDKSG